MAKENYMINRKKRILFYILMAAVLCWFVVLQIFGTNERDKKTIEQNILYQGTFVWEKSDGSREQIEVPGRYELSAKETMVLVTQLPEDYDEKALAIRSSLQEVRFYVDGVLRAEYDTSDTRLAGKNSASRYVFCPTTEADVGKEVRIELKTNTAKYSGVVNAVYCGDKAEIHTVREWLSSFWNTSGRSILCEMAEDHRETQPVSQRSRKGFERGSHDTVMELCVYLSLSEL